MPCNGRLVFTAKGRPSLLVLIPFFILLVILTYWPGLEGDFHFDDFANVAKLADFGGVNNTRDFLAYVLGGISGPTGRPISLLSFLLNDTTWPSDARSFLYTNLILHCLNGLLLVWVLYRLLQPAVGYGGNTAALVAIIAGALWSLHPLHVSTVLYVVQRMTQLSALFTLVGLLSYFVGRERLLRGKEHAYFWMSTAVVLFMPLAIFSKENGVLLPLLVLVLEGTVVRYLWPVVPVPAFWWRVVFLYTPSAFILGYLGYRGLQGLFSESSGFRDFTSWERLLTQARIVLHYLAELILPRMQTSGLFSDFSVSRSLFTPPSTLASVIVVAFLLIIAFKFKKTFPIVAAAILFFFVGHLLESTVIKLELYFEHRNYIPSMFLFLPVGMFFVKGSLSPGLRIVILIVVVSMLSFLTWQRASLWGNPVALTFTWAEESPGSARAQRSAALKWNHLGRPDKSLQVLERASETISDNLSIQLHALLQKCQAVGVQEKDVDAAVLKAENIPERVFDLNIMQWLLTEMVLPGCRGVEVEDVLDILKALEKNTGVKETGHRVRLVYHIEGVVHLLRGSGTEAYQAFLKCYEITPNLPTVMNQVGLLATYRHFELALAHLSNAEEIDFQPDWKEKITTLDYLSEIEVIKQQLVKDIALTRDSNESGSSSGAPEEE